MKRLIITFAILIGTSLAVFAQPKSAGLRFGGTGLDVTYQHYMGKDRFAEGNLGLDFGYNVNGNVGIKATAIYNFVWARPAWTDQGSWALYAGPGLSLGFVDDQVPYDIAGVIKGYYDNGFMLSLVGQVGLEYNFEFPLSLSIDIRPYIGMHINDGKFRVPNTDTVVSYESKIGFYDNGLLGLTPTISVRYRF